MFMFISALSQQQSHCWPSCTAALHGTVQLAHTFTAIVPVNISLA